MKVSGVVPFGVTVWSFNDCYKLKPCFLVNVHKQRMREDFRGQRHGFCTRAARTSPQPASRRQGKIRDLMHRKDPAGASPIRALCAQRAALIRAKAFAKDKGSIGSEGALRRPSDLMSTFGRKLWKFQENNAERTESPRTLLSCFIPAANRLFAALLAFAPTRAQKFAKIFMRSVAIGAKPNVSAARKLISASLFLLFPAFCPGSRTGNRCNRTCGGRR